MPKEVLFEIIKKGLYLNFVFIIIIFIIGNTVFLKLMLRFHNINVGLKKLAPFVIGSVIFLLIGKQFLPGTIYGIVLVALYTCFIYFIHKLPILKIFFTVLAVMLLSSISIISIVQPLTLYQKNFLSFLTGTPMGIALGSLLEMALPAIVLLLFSIFKIHLQTSKFKTTLLDFLGIILFAITFFTIYYLIVLFVWTYQHNINSPAAMLVFELILFAIGGLIFFYIFKHTYQKQLKQQYKLTEMEHSNRLIETIYSERREYQNNLQVMRIMAAMGVTKELEDYMGKVIRNLLRSGGITHINDPILVAAIITHQVKAKEYNIAIIVNSNKPLHNIDKISFKLGEIFNIFLDLMIENILTIKNSPQVIIIDIDENQTSYSFSFKTSEIVDLNKRKPQILPAKNPYSLKQLVIAKNIIKELNGSFYPTIIEGRILRLKLIIEKNHELSGMASSSI